MKVLFITREGYELAGARVRCHNFARELNSAGIEAGVFSFAEQLGAKCGEKEFEMSLWWKLWLNIRAFKVLMKEGPDTVFFLQRVNYHILAPLFVVLLKKNRFIFDCDDWNMRENPVYHFGFYPSSKMEYLTGRVARKAAACIAASNFLYEYLCPFNRNTHRLVTGVDAALFMSRPRPDDGRVTFSWTGTAYHPEMGDNLKFILECFTAVADKQASVFLSLAGEGKYFEEIRNTARQHKHGSRILIHTWIPADNMPEYLSGIDVGLLPLIQATKFNLGKSPTKLFEYMSMGKPVVASSTGEARHIVRHGQTGFLAEDKERFIEGMCVLAEDVHRRRCMGLEARKDVEAKYALKVLGRQLVGIIEGITGKT
ncbi:MAG: glycosyltransferase [Candidatus Omnitrophica bacterium]|nr:glycosyltransferase [Candidatus Omnitrophota bacterium]